jgi:tetratricopeptide (TPR) repeat protein
MKPQFKDEVRLQEHRFVILTGTDLPNRQIVSEVLEQGRPRYRKYAPIPARYLQSGDDVWNEKAQQIHERMIGEIQTMFIIEQKLKNVSNFLYHFRFGRILLSYNFIDEAIEHFKKAVENKPDFAKAHRKLAACYLKKEDFPEARYILKKVVDSGLTFPDMYNDLAVAYTFLKEYDAAKNMLQKAVELKNDFPEADFNLGLLLFYSTINEQEDAKIVIPVRLIRALKNLRNAKHLREKFWQEHINTILEKIASHETDNILPMLRDLQLKITTRDDPASIEMDFFFLKFLFGNRVLSNDELDYYEQLIRAEVENRGNYADFWNDLGVIHLIQSRNYFLNALEEIEQAAEINPNFSEAQENVEKIRRIKSGFLILLRALLR